MHGEHFELNVKGKLENLPAIIDFTIGSLKRLGADDSSTFDIQLAVDEITTNIIQYAYADKAGDIWVSCRKDGGAVVVTIRDGGRPFDPTKVSPPDLDTDLEHREIGGLGIYLAKKAMDSVAYRYADGQNILTMRKSIK